MQSTGLLFTIAQIAVGLAGFSAIIATLNAKPIREWDDTDRLNLRLLIQISIYVIFSHCCRPCWPYHLNPILSGCTVCGRTA